LCVEIVLDSKLIALYKFYFIGILAIDIVVMQVKYAEKHVQAYCIIKAEKELKKMIYGVKLTDMDDNELDSLIKEGVEILDTTDEEIDDQ
jgi:hypothetical protein